MNDLVKQKLFLKNYSANTQKVYLYFIRDYLLYCQRNLIIDHSIESITKYVLSLLDKGQSRSTQNQAINALKFYFEHIEGWPRFEVKIERPRKEQKLPTVMSQGEISRLMKAVRNQKHQLILVIIYSCGLRISELQAIQIKDIDSGRMCIHIRNGKGAKDRMVPLPKQLLKSLRRYYVTYQPKKYLFEGRPTDGETAAVKYSTSSIRQILKRAVKRAKINKHVTPHTLRHSYATHLYENGINLRSIQTLLGHSSSKTTEIYTHVSQQHIINTPNPLDFF